MTGTTYIEDLSLKLRDVEKELARARKAIAEGDLSEKANAIAELVRMEARSRELTERIEAAKEQNSDQWSDLHKGFQKDIDGLKNTLEAWITQFI